MNLAAHNFHHRRIRPLVPGSRTFYPHFSELIGLDKLTDPEIPASPAC